MWEFRNEKLHEEDKIKELEGVPELERSIRRQRNIGIQGLPVSEYSYMFRLKEDELIKQSVESKKRWLATVLLERELHEEEEINGDEFEESAALRKWIGLE